jgi:anti-sigma B factor antagonist
MSLTRPSAATTTHASKLAVIDLACSGPLDAAVTLTLRDAVVRAAADGPVLVLLDVSGIRALDASGVVGLVEVLRQVRSRGGDLRLHGTSPALIDAQLEAHLGQVARIYPDRRHAENGGASPERGDGHRCRSRSIRNRFFRRVVSLAWMRA